ncbi:MAG: sugar ABC transporter permease [Spirochaetota bacterium]
MRHKDTITAWVFLLPSLAGFVIFLALPVLFSLILAFSSWDIAQGLRASNFIGFEQFRRLPSDEWFISSLANNFLYTAVVVPVTMAISLVFAVILSGKILFRNMLRVLFFIPYIVSIIALSVVWMAMFNPQLGPVNEVLRALGFTDPPRWLASRSCAFPTIMMMMIWRGLGYNIIIYLAGLQSIPNTLYEAASIDGANAVQQFFRITVPLLAATTFFLFVTQIIASFLLFGPINVMTQGGPARATTVLVYYIYKQAFAYNNIGYGAAISWVMFLLVFSITLVQWAGQKKGVDHAG